MANQIILENDYSALASTHYLWTRNRPRWQFYYESYVGGEEYRDAAHLTRYQLETDREYTARLQNTPLDNHCASVIQTYISFLFREHPERDFESWEGLPQVEAFLKDADLEGRSLDAFMKQVSIWASTFGHCWIIMTKGNMGVETQAQEQALGIRPYVNLLTPLIVSDWRWERQGNGAYDLVYFKYVEEVVDKITTVKEWTKDVIRTIVLDDRAREVRSITEEVNQLGVIPAVLVYNLRSIIKDIGVSDLEDISDVQRQIYNLMSENEQAIRLEGHPSLVVPPTAQVGSGAGAIIQIQEGTDPGLRPYFLEVGTGSVDNIHRSIDKLVEAIDRMSFTGGVRTTRTQVQSGISLETEFQLLNAKLAEKAQQMELAEEQLWRLFALYENLEWEGEIHYPNSFNIRDDDRTFDQLVKAKTAATDARVLQVIDHELIEMLGEDADLLLPEYQALMASTFPPKPLFEAHIMYNPETEEEVIARTEAEHIQYQEQGYIHKED